MKHIFIVNPAAGPRDVTQRILTAVAAYPDLDCEVYRTTAPRDATRYVRERCEASDEPIRFYACGGDGTINEVAEGLIGFPHASFSCYPCGSGNDFVKYYGGAELFSDLSRLFSAEAAPVDIMKVNERYSVNVANFGLDAAVARRMIEVRRKPVIGGKRAYTTGVIHAFLYNMKTHCTVTADGEVLNPSGIMLLTTLSCGRYVGGSYCCAPRSDNTDGLMEVSLVRPVSRLSFLRMKGIYQRGEHLDDPRTQTIFTYRQARVVTVEAPEPIAFCVDGEMMQGTSFRAEILPGAVCFAAPKRTGGETKQP